MLGLVPDNFSQDIGDWPQNQILISHWTHFHSPGTTLGHNHPSPEDSAKENFLAGWENLFLFGLCTKTGHFFWPFLGDFLSATIGRFIKAKSTDE